MPDSLIQKPQWIPLALVMEVVADSKRDKWDWFKNSKCKYIELRIDMRTASCLIRDRDGNPITLEQLQFQYGKEEA